MIGEVFRDLDRGSDLRIAEEIPNLADASACGESHSTCVTFLPDELGHAPEIVPVEPGRFPHRPFRECRVPLARTRPGPPGFGHLAASFAMIASGSYTQPPQTPPLACWRAA